MDDSGTRELAQSLRKQLGPTTQVAVQVNGVKGLWVSFEMDGDATGFRPIWSASTLRAAGPG